MKITSAILSILFLMTVTTLFCTCSHLMASFDQTSYSQVTALKVDALALIDKSTEDYSSHVSEVEKLNLEMDKAIEYDKHRPKNEVTNAMWDLMSDPKGHLLGGYLAKWKADGKETAGEISDIKGIVGSNFDRVADLEIKKLKSNSN